MSDGTDTLTYTYNQFNQLKTIKKNDSTFATYTYDSRGNQIKESQVYMTVGDTKYNQVTDYTYDLQNQMTQAKITTPDYVNNAVVNNEVIQTNAYNASGQRIRKVEDNETTNYYYMGSALLLSANANNWLLTENILDPSGTIVASARFDDTNPGVAEGFYFYHYDMRGSTTAIVDADGLRKKGYEYDVFGTVEEATTSSFLNEVTFTGSVTDTSTGLQYMNARFYNPSTGRFNSQDSYSGNPYDPWTQNLYTYCGNNPTNMVDPTGHVFNFIAAAVGAVVGAATSVVINGISNKIQGKDFWEGAGVAAVGGAITGLAAGITCGASLAVSAAGKVAVAAGAYGLSSMASSAVTQGMTKGWDNIDPAQVAWDGIKGAVGGAIGQAVSNAVTSNLGKSLYNTGNNSSFSKNSSVKSNGTQSKQPQLAIETPHGSAVQDMSQKALQVKNNVQNGATLYRGGTFGKSNTTSAQFWATENPLSPGYADKYGVAFDKLDYVITAHLKKGAAFITRVAPGLGTNSGGGIEVVVNPNSVIMDSFYMP